MFMRKCRRGLLRVHAALAAAAVTFFALILWGGICLGQAAGQAGGLTAGELAQKAVSFIQEKYAGGEKIDGYAAYVLSRAGEDLGSSKWVAGPWWTSVDLTLKEKILTLARLIGNGENGPLDFVLRTQNPDGTFGPYANAYGTAAPLEALALARSKTVGSSVYGDVGAAVGRAVSYFKNGYTGGQMPYDAAGWGLNYRAVEALAAAGEDLSSQEWVYEYEGVSLKQAAVSSAVYAAENAAGLDAVRLAKELIALWAATGGGQSYNETVQALCGAILGKAVSSGSGELYFCGEYGESLYDDVLVLTALGKAGALGEIDADKALAYLNRYRIEHSVWGVPAGAGWNGWDASAPEPDTTAQVIVALSFFPGAADEKSNIYRAIKDGLDYLASIQEQDTAAVPSPWDSTYSTAETVIVLESLARIETDLYKNYTDYWSSASPWKKKARTKTIALCLLATSQWEGCEETVDRLAGLLAGRQIKEGEGAGSFENSVYSDMWAYLALAEAGKLDLIDKSAALNYILAKQAKDGSFGETFDQYYPDFMSSAQAVRALYALAPADSRAQEAILKALGYFKGLLQDDGGVYAPGFDDPAVDNAELIVTLNTLGQDPAGEDWQNARGLTPVHYLLHKSYNAGDKSFGACRNVFSAAEVLAALLTIDPNTVLPEVSQEQSAPGGSTGGSSAPKDSVRVNIAVVGESGELLFGPGKVSVEKSNPYGLTVLGALWSTGLDLEVDSSSGFVRAIGGQANRGMNGWMYKVNGNVPAVSAKDRRLSGGEEIIWWYSTDINSTGPNWSDLTKGSQTSAVTAATVVTTTAELPPSLKPSDEVLKRLADLITELKNKEFDLSAGIGEAGTRLTAVTGTAAPDNFKVIIRERRQINQKEISISQPVEALTGAVMAPEGGEVALSVPAGALSRTTNLTIKKQLSSAPMDNGGVPPLPPGFRPVSPTYSLGPAGTTFLQPATLVLKCPLPPAVAPEDVVLGAYDRESGKWVALPAVLDASQGLITANVERLLDVTVLVKEKRLSFGDVDQVSYGWAQAEVEKLAGAGILKGVGGGRFEPARQISRAELAAVLVRALGIRGDAGSSVQFTDVSGSEWYAPYTAAAAAAGLFIGYGDGTFGPERPVTRQEIAAVLVRAGEFTAASGAKLTFADAGSVESWAAGAIAAAVEEGLVKGYGDGTFKPLEPVTRAECAVLVYRTLARL